MFIISDAEILDLDITLLEDVLRPLDEALIRINERVEIAKNESSDLDSSGLFDTGEHIIGLAFTACQKYMSSTFSKSGIKKEDALNCGPKHVSGERCARIIHAAANYWKHCDEWDKITAVPIPDSQMMQVITRDYGRLENRQKLAINTIENVSSWSDYTLSNVLIEITLTNKLSVLELIPILLEWRNALISNEAI